MFIKAAATVTAIGVIAGGVVAADSRYAPASAVAELKSELRVDRVFSLVDQSKAQGSPGWLCGAIEKEFIQLCTDQPEHYLCQPEAKREMMARAGC